MESKRPLATFRTGKTQQDGEPCGGGGGGGGSNRNCSDLLLPSLISFRKLRKRYKVTSFSGQIGRVGLHELRSTQTSARERESTTWRSAVLEPEDSAYSER